MEEEGSKIKCNLLRERGRKIEQMERKKLLVDIISKCSGRDNSRKKRERTNSKE